MFTNAILLITLVGGTGFEPVTPTMSRSGDFNEISHLTTHVVPRAASETAVKSPVRASCVSACQKDGDSGAMRLYREVSISGETMDQFAMRITSRAATKTAALKAEICGAIRMDVSGTFDIQFFTTKQAKACTIPPATNVVATFHTHPSSASMHFSAGDYAFHGYMARGNRLWHQAGKGTEREVMAK